MHYQVFKLEDNKSNRPFAIIEAIKVLIAGEHLQHFDIFSGYFGLSTNALY
jgi:hypothetical protein